MGKKKTKKALKDIVRQLNKLQTTVGDLVQQMHEQSGHVVVESDPNTDNEDGGMVIHSGFHSEEQAHDFIAMMKAGDSDLRWTHYQLKTVPQEVLDSVELREKDPAPI